MAKQRRPASRTPKKKASGRKGAPGPTWRGWLLRKLLAVLAGAGAGATIVVYGLYLGALQDVDAMTSRPIWTASGRVLSAPLEVYKGLSLKPEELARDLQGAGYARVAHASQPGDFEVSETSVRVINRAEAGPGWKIEAGEVSVTFAGGRVSKVGPAGRVRFAPTELAGMRSGSDARTPVTLEKVPIELQHAVLAMEDARFYEHKGLDPLGIVRALLLNVVTDRGLQGGSTLTQQLAKNLFLTQERTVERKAREVLFAVALEQRLSKDQILELYLNAIYLGHVGGVGVAGMDQAARAYFGKSVERLELGEAAMLGGIISGPNLYAPLRHPERAVERRNLALDRMVAVGWLDAATAEAEKEKALIVHPGASGRQAPWGVDAAVDEVEGALGAGSVAARGLAVHTTLQPALQRLGEQVVVESLAELVASRPAAAGAQMALVAVRVSDGAIVAMVGGSSYADSQFNRASHARRQAGSTVKPLTLALAFDDDHSLSPATVVVDEPIERRNSGRTWAPQNYDGQFVGPVTLREALAHSRNVPAVLVAEMVGMKDLEAGWKRFGLTGATSLPSAALGSFDATPLELAGAYAAIRAGGVVHEPWVMAAAAVDDRVELAHSPMTQRVVDEEAAFLAQAAMEQVMLTGTGAGASRYGVNGAVGGKSGTTDDARDAWFVGFTGELAVAVWVGFDKDKVLGLGGSKAALPAWARFVAGSGTVGQFFMAPDGLERVALCAESREPASDECPDVVEDWFREGEAPDEQCSLHAPDEGLFGRRRGEHEDGAGGDEGGGRGWFGRRRR